MRMNFSRRGLILGSIAAAFVDKVFAVPPGIGERPVMPMPPGVRLPRLDQIVVEKGALPAWQSEIATAERVLAKAPKTVNPFKVAQYFERVGMGHENPSHEDWSQYTQEWPERYNPVIRRFFDAVTDATPEGDCTAWCAAFVNWCIKRGREERPDGSTLLEITHSAASRKFRTWGTETANPKPGDIAVFINPNHTERGHVGFLSHFMNGKVWVLGGNQIDINFPEITTCSDPNDAGGKVTTAEIGSSLVFHSFRTDPSLHDLA